MRAYLLTAPRTGSVVEVDAPVAAAGEVVVDVHRVGICGTDVEFFTGRMAYLEQGHARYPIRLGHEWCGTVGAVGPGVDPGWLGRRVTGDTMIGCGRCERCRAGRHNVCATRSEVGIRGGVHGALAEQLAVPATALLALPDTVDDTAGALVEPGGNALRAVRAARLSPGSRLLVLGTGAIGLLVAAFARAEGGEVHLQRHPDVDPAFPASCGVAGVWTQDELPALAWHAVVDASNARDLPALAVDLVEPGGTVVLIGLAGGPSRVDTRDLVLQDVTAVGVLAASQGLAGTIEHFAAGHVDPTSLVGATVALERTGDVLAGWRPDHAGPGPKMHIDPRR